MIQPKDCLDIRSDLCPITLVKVLLALDSLSCGEVLEVLVTDGNAVKNLPRSLTGGGHIVRSIEKSEDSYYIMYVEKCGVNKIAEQ